MTILLEYEIIDQRTIKVNITLQYILNSTSLVSLYDYELWVRLGLVQTLIVYVIYVVYLLIVDVAYFKMYDITEYRSK